MCAAEPAAGVASVEFFVSPQGNDAWSGRLADPGEKDGPFDTIVRARDAVRELPPAVRATRPVVVSIRGGTYQVNEPIVFGPQDSGTKKYPVTYQAFRGEVPMLSGGRPITGWMPAEDGLWKVHVPEVVEGEWYFRQLFVNGRRAQRARTPNAGSFFIADGMISMDSPAAFSYRGTDIDPAWAQDGEVEVVALQAWAEIRMQIRAVDPSTRRVTLSGQCASSNREENPRYWIENARDALDEPGEWYLDRQHGDVYYLPRAGEDMTKAEVIAPRLTQLMRLDGDPAAQKVVAGLVIRGLTFAHSDWTLAQTGYTDLQAAFDIPAALEANGARGVVIERCRFTHLGTYGVSFGRGCKDNTIDHNEVYHRSQRGHRRRSGWRQYRRDRGPTGGD